MSMITIGQIWADVNDEYEDINIETGRGWGGDGVNPYRVILNCPDKDIFVMMTLEQALHLCDLIQTIATVDK